MLTAGWKGSERREFRFTNASIWWTRSISRSGADGRYQTGSVGKLACSFGSDIERGRYKLRDDNHLDT